MLTVSSANRMDTLLGYIQRTQDKISKAEYQVSTGTKGPVFTDYENVSGVINIQKAIAHREAFMTNAESANVTLTLVNNGLEDVLDIATEAEQFAQHNSYSYVAAEDLANTAAAWLASITSVMNMEGPEGYLFGGLDGDGPPVNYTTDVTDSSWTTLVGDPDDPLFDPTVEGPFWFLNKAMIGTTAAGLTFDYEGSWPTTLSPSYPYEDYYYDGGRLYDANGQIDEGLVTRIDTHQSVATGYSAAEGGIQKLMYALHMIALTPIPDENPPAGDPSFAEQKAFYLKNIESARDMIAEAVDEITAINIRAASTQITVEGTLERHAETLALQQNMFDSLVEVDEAEAIVTYQALQTNLEATYQVTSRLSDLTLAKYL